MKPIRVALVGCGAVSKANLMPVLAGHDGIVVTTLVDRSEARARELASAYGVPNVLTDMDALSAKDIDAVVLATPPAHHAPATIALAAKGLHVLVEKPMATKLADAQAMVDAADRARVALAVGLYRRKLPAVRLLKALLESGEFGRPLSIDIEEGGPYGWALATLDLLTSTVGGGGVLIDIGSHVIDLILFALPGAASLTSYEDNARGGIETDCQARFVISSARGPVPVRVELSRTRELRNTIRVQCEHATIELLRGNFFQLIIHRPASTTTQTPARPVRMTAEWTGFEAFNGYDAFRAQIDDWLDAVRSGSAPELSGRSVLPVVGLIDACYGHRTLMSEPWVEEGLTTLRSTPAAAAPDARKRVLVTGAGGFLGGRVVELLNHKYGYQAVALIKEPKGAARLARWTDEILLGDVCSASDMDRAMRGCDAVVHCAVGTSWKPEEVRQVTVGGTKTVAEAALRAKVRRFVHISTMAVHRRDAVGVLDETIGLGPAPEDDYGTNKLHAEEAVKEQTAKGLSSITLRPARIYGPFSKTFTVRPLQALSEGRFVVAGDPNVPANMVYVDNVADAIARALEAPDTLRGAAYLINDADQMSLRDFFDFFATPGGPHVKLGALPSATTARPAGFVRRWMNGVKTVVVSSEVRALVHRVMDTDPIGTLPRKMWDRSPALQARLLRLFGVDVAIVHRPAQGEGSNDLLYSGDPAVVSSAKAQRELGFVPPVSRERAMALTMAWAQSARLVPVDATRVATEDASPVLSH